MPRLLCLLCITVLTLYQVDGSPENNGVLHKIKAGLEYATNYLETAKDIADLVAKSLGHNSKRGEDDVKQKGTFGTSNLVSAFFRLVGLDSQKVTAIAVNSVIFLAQMIGSLFDLKPPKENLGRSFEDDLPWNPADLITESKNDRIQRLLNQAQDDELPNQLIERIEDVNLGCVRLLLCKTSPVIRGVQNFLRNKTRNESHRMTSWLPSRDQFEENSDECENTHTDCSLFS
ncbi:uncharacterized protein LOC100883833 [Megachile rotundata]|uniref:uncharacterized protein LOC100883833 n=1 Tax=Megachile rotundata TaxID=143995 RepID=UPI003FD0929D